MFFNKLLSRAFAIFFIKLDKIFLQNFLRINVMFPVYRSFWANEISKTWNWVTEYSLETGKCSEETIMTILATLI